MIIGGRQCVRSAFFLCDIREWNLSGSRELPALLMSEMPGVSLLHYWLGDIDGLYCDRIVGVRRRKNGAGEKNLLSIVSQFVIHKCSSTVWFM